MYQKPSRRHYCFQIFTILVLFNLGFASAYITVYEDSEFKGMLRTLPHFRACLNFVKVWDDRISSINTHDYCIVLCEHKDCKGRCERFEPGSWRHNHFGALDFNDKASSYRNCD